MNPEFLYPHTEYQLLAKKFASTINITHPQHNDTTIDYPHLSWYVHQNHHHPPPRLLFALITTISPQLETCNQLLILTQTPHWTTLLLESIALLQNPPERHITTLHPYRQFKNTNQKIIEPPNFIHKEIYDFIKQTNEPKTLHYAPQTPIFTWKFTHKNTKVHRYLGRILSPHSFT